MAVVESFDVGTLRLASGEARRLEFEVPVAELAFGGQTYSAGGYADALLDVSHTTTGHALRLRFAVALHGPCTRCLEDANAKVEVDAREIDQPGESEELRSPYVEEDIVDLSSWARDALALALPTQILCSRGLPRPLRRLRRQPQRDPDHAHEAEPDPRWAKLRAEAGLA